MSASISRGTLRYAVTYNTKRGWSRKPHAPRDWHTANRWHFRRNESAEKKPRSKCLAGWYMPHATNRCMRCDTERSRTVPYGVQCVIECVNLTRDVTLRRPLQHKTSLVAHAPPLRFFKGQRPQRQDNLRNLKKTVELSFYLWYNIVLRKRLFPSAAQSAAAFHLRSARKRCRPGPAQLEPVNLVRWGTKQR